MLRIRATKRDIAAVDALLLRAYPRLLKGGVPTIDPCEGAAVGRSRTARAGGLWDLLCGGGGRASCLGRAVGLSGLQAKAALRTVLAIFAMLLRMTVPHGVVWRARC